MKRIGEPANSARYTLRVTYETEETEHPCRRWRKEQHLWSGVAGRQKHWTLVPNLSQ
jgi:hypothetical protein